MLRKMWLRGVVLFVVLLPAALASSVKVVGFDDMSCREWVRSREEADQRKLYVVWIRGFLSGHNYANPKTPVSAISGGTIEQYVTRYCVDKPLGDFGDAAQRLSDQFSGRNAPITK